MRKRPQIRIKKGLAPNKLAKGLEDHFYGLQNRQKAEWKELKAKENWIDSFAMICGI